MRTRPRQPAVLKRRILISPKQTRPSISLLARKMAEVEVLRDKVRKSETKKVAELIGLRSRPFN